MKKLFSFLIAAAMIFNLVPVVYAANPTVNATVTAQKSGNTVVVTVTLPPVKAMISCIVSVQFDPAIVSIPNQDGYPATFLYKGKDIPYFSIGQHVGGIPHDKDNIVKNAFINANDEGVTTTKATPFARFVFTIKNKNVEPVFNVKLEQFEDASTIISEANGYYIEEPAIPSAPASVKAASTSYNSIKISWAAALDATGYDIYCSATKTGTYKKIGTTTSTSFTNASLTTGTEYFYKVKAYNKYKNKTCYGGFSAIVSAKPAPSVPANPKASVSYNSAKLTWSAVSGATGYEVWYATSQTGKYTKIGTTNSKTLTYTHKSLTTGKTYYYKIRAYRTVSKINYYSYFTAVTAKPLPTVPGSVKAASASYNSVKISWKAVSGATGYVVYWSTAEKGTYTKLGTTNSKTLTYTHKSLTTGKTYYYKVRTYRTVSKTNYYSSYSAAYSAKPLPSVPGSVKAASASYNSVKISWKAVSGATGYVIYYATSSTGTYTKLGTTNSKTLTYTHKSLTTGKTLYYKVRAYRTVNKTNYYGNYSAAVSGRPVPSAPASFTAAKASSTSVKVSWKAVSGATAYQVYRATSASGTYTLVKTTTSKSLTNTGLTKGKTYYYKVRAYRKVGSTITNGSYTAVKSIKL